MNLTAIIIVALLFVGAPAVILHYVTKWREQNTLKPGDEHMMGDLYDRAKRMERRIESLEAILDAEAPGWRTKEGG